MVYYKFLDYYIAHYIVGFDINRRNSLRLQDGRPSIYIYI